MDHKPFRPATFCGICRKQFPSSEYMGGLCEACGLCFCNGCSFEFVLTNAKLPLCMKCVRGKSLKSTLKGYSNQEEEIEDAYEQDLQRIQTQCSEALSNLREECITEMRSYRPKKKLTSRPGHSRARPIRAVEEEA